MMYAGEFRQGAFVVYLTAWVAAMKL